GDGPPVLGDRVVGRVGEPLMGRQAVVEAGRLRRQDVALLVGEELLDRVRLLDVRNVPITDPLPGGVGVAAEYQLTPRGVDLQELRAVGMAPERRVDHETGGELVSSVDDFGLFGKHLPLNFEDRLRGIAAARAARAGLRRRPY